MSRYGVKCATPTCHRRHKMDAVERANLRAEGEKFNVKAQILCPNCVAKALDNPELFAVDMSLGEVIVQVTREDAPWRIVLMPDPELVKEQAAC